MIVLRHHDPTWAPTVTLTETPSHPPHIDPFSWRMGVCCRWKHGETACALQVLVGTHTVLANGGIMAPVGTHVVALAAKHHSCPFVVLTGLHKLSPLFPHDPSVTFNDFKVRP